MSAAWGSADDMAGFVVAVEAYQSAERLSELFPDQRLFWRTADRRFLELTKLAMRAGFPARDPGTPLIIEWAVERAQRYASRCPLHVAEARRKALQPAQRKAA